MSLLKRAASLAAALLVSALMLLALLTLTRNSAAQAAHASAAAVDTPETRAALKAMRWLSGTQNADGSIVSFATPGTPGAIGDVAEALMAARAARIAPAMIVTGTGKNLLSPLNSVSVTAYLNNNVDRMGKLALGLAAADLDPRSYLGLDLVLSMTQRYSATSGAFGVSNWDQALGMLGWAAAGESIPVTATRLLASRILTDGGFGFSPGMSSDTNSTGLMLQALAAGGHPVTSTEVLSAHAYLKQMQRSDAGWDYDGSSTVSDANSTSYVLQGLLATGADPLSTTFLISGTSPVAFLLSQQNPDGSFVYPGIPGPNASATVQSVPALLGAYAPYPSRAVALRKALAYLRTQQEPNGGFIGFGVGSTVDAIIAVKATGADLNSFVSISGVTPLQYLATQAPTYPRSSAAAAGKFVLGVIAAGGNAQDIGGINAVLSMTQQFSSTTGRYGSTVWDQSWTLLGQRAANIPISPTQVAQLSSIAVISGGFGFFANDSEADPDSTGLALMALRVSGVPITAPVVQNAIAYLRSSQLSDGGFGYGAPPSNANSTGYAVQGLAAYGLTPFDLSFARPSTERSALILSTPVDRLLALQLPDGSFASDFSVATASYGAVPGLAYQPLPISTPRTLYLPTLTK
jgi:prenyltransferase beta subunit